eukprot:gene44063-59672_t
MLFFGFKPIDFKRFCNHSGEGFTVIPEIVTPPPRAGSLHTDELLGAVVAVGSGLRTERRISHVYAMSVPAYPKPLIVTDAAINILPTLEQ